MKLAILVFAAAVTAVGVSCSNLEVNQAPAIRGRAKFTVTKKGDAVYDLTFELPSDAKEFKPSCAVFLRFDSGVYHAEKKNEKEEAGFPNVLDQTPAWEELKYGDARWYWTKSDVNLKGKEVLWVHVRVDFPNGESSYAYRVYPLVQPMEFVDVYLPD